MPLLGESRSKASNSSLTVPLVAGGALFIHQILMEERLSPGTIPGSGNAAQNRRDKLSSGNLRSNDLKTGFSY